MGEDYGYQDPEVEIKESGDVDFVEFLHQKCCYASILIFSLPCKNVMAMR